LGLRVKYLQVSVLHFLLRALTNQVDVLTREATSQVRNATCVVCPHFNFILITTRFPVINISTDTIFYLVFF